MSSMEYLTIKNWRRFQHYNHRNPPWIKLHFEIMTSEDWTMLSDASKLLAVVCMMIASRNQGNVPNNPEYIKRVAYLDKLPDLKPLIKCGFFEKVLADASECKQGCTNADTETETETERSIKKTPTPFELPDWVPEPDWIDYLEMRKAKKVPTTNRAKQEAVLVLQRLQNDGNAPSKVLRQSILNGWTGLFAIKTERASNGTKYPSYGGMPSVAGG